MTRTDLTAAALRRDPLPLRGRVAVVTGASVFLHHYAPHDRGQPWGADPGGPEAVVAGVTNALALDTAGVDHLELDLAGASAPDRLINAATDAFGHLDIRVCNHARSGGDGALGTLDAAMLDAHWAVNTRSAILLAQAFAAQHDGRPAGRIIFLTSGQDLGPLRDEVAYAASKGALAFITRTLADHLADQAITLNTINPGPVDTGYAPPEVREALRRRFPQARWGLPDDAARLVAWMTTDEAGWITGQIINSEGGFRRWD